MQETTAVAVDSKNSTVFAGNFRGSIDLGGGPRTAANGSQRFFLASFGP